MKCLPEGGRSRRMYFMFQKIGCGVGVIKGGDKFAHASQSEYTKENTINIIMSFG